MMNDRCPWCDMEFEQDELAIDMDGLLYHDECFAEAAPKILLDRYGAYATYFHRYDEDDDADFRREDYFNYT